MGVGALAGAWRVVSAYVEFADTGETADTLGASPEGWIVFSEGGRMIGMLTAAGRKDASADGDFERLFKSMVAYSGAVQVDEPQGKFVNRVDTAWQPGWVGTEQVRYFTVDEDVLNIRSAEQTLPQFGDRRLTSIVTFRRA
jgi:hypothetical protein